MKARTILFLFFFLSGIGMMAAEDEPVVEMRADRTIIYPQRMELNGEETLFDILEMYPDLLSTDLSGTDLFDGWQLRMDNVVLSGDTRLMVTQIKARQISKIQVCDNASVAKGRNGDGRVIDINLARADDGAHGFASVQGATDKMLAPSGIVRYGSGNTELWSSATYTHTDKSGQVDNAENLHLQMTNRLTQHDRLLTYVTQSSSVSDTGERGYSKHNRSESFMARMRYFHVFNDQGTELLTLLSWQHKNSPANTLDATRQSYRRVASHTNVPIWLLELNTPLPVKGLSMMLGYEGDIDINRYGIRQSPVDGGSFDEESTYRVMNNDLYLQFNYIVGPLRLTVGDRVMFYHYRQKSYADDWSENATRNHFQASAILKLARRHQLQVGYFRKFRNPSAMSVFPDLWPNASGLLTGGDPTLEEKKIDQYKVGYNYGTRRLNATLAGSFYHPSEGGDYWTVCGTIYKKLGILSVTGGFDIYNIKVNDSRTTYGDIRLSPVLYLPNDWQAAARLVWFSKDSPHRAAMDDTALYGSLQLNKQICKHWDLQVMWHDMFYNKQSACLAGIMYRF
jgi:hypothetical protein